MKQLSYVCCLFGPKHKSLEGRTGQMEGTSYREQTVTISGRSLAWNIKPFTWKIKRSEMLQGAWVLVQCFHTTWASIGNLHTCDSHPAGRIQNVGKQSADKNNSTHGEGITLNKKMIRKYSVWRKVLLLLLEFTNREWENGWVCHIYGKHGIR
jgi:hypothetical protein